MGIKAGELFVEIKVVGADKATTALAEVEKELKNTKTSSTELAKDTVDGADKATTALAKVEKKLKNTKTLSTELAKHAKEVFASAGDIDVALGGIESAASTIGGFLGPIGGVATGIAAAGYALYKFSDIAGGVAIDLHALQVTTGFPEALAAQYEYAAQSVGVSAGTMINAISGIAHMSAQAMETGVVAQPLINIQKLTGRILTKDIVQSPEKTFEYVVNAVKGSKLPALVKTDLLSSALGIGDPRALAKLLEPGGISPSKLRQDVAEGKGILSRDKIESLRTKGETAAGIAASTKFQALNIGDAAINVGTATFKFLEQGTKKTIDEFLHPEGIEQPYDRSKRLKQKGAKSKFGIPVGQNDSFKIDENNIVGRNPAAYAANNTSNVNNSKSTNVNVNLSTLASADDTANAIFRVARLSHAQVYVT